MNTTTAERKAGKLERIRLLLENIRAKQPKSMVEMWSDAVTLPKPPRNITPLITLPTDRLLEELEANLDDMKAYFNNESAILGREGESPNGKADRHSEAVEERA